MQKGILIAPAPCAVLPQTSGAALSRGTGIAGGERGRKEKVPLGGQNSMPAA